MKKLADEMIGADEGMYFHGTLIDIICCEKSLDRNTISTDIATECMVAGQEIMLAMHFIMNADYERYSDVIDRYDKDYLSGVNNYPKSLHSAYLLLKNWKITAPRGGMRNNKLGLSFNVNGNDKDEHGDTLVNEGQNTPCPRCGRTNHTLDKYRS